MVVLEVNPPLFIKFFICFNCKQHGTRVERVTELLEYIKRSPQWRLHGLLRSLHENDQDHVIRVFGMDPDDYSDQMEDDNTENVSDMQNY